MGSGPRTLGNRVKGGGRRQGDLVGAQRRACGFKAMSKQKGFSTRAGLRGPRAAIAAQTPSGDLFIKGGKRVPTSVPTQHLWLWPSVHGGGKGMIRLDSALISKSYL